MAAKIQFFLGFLAGAMALIGLCTLLFERNKARLDTRSAQKRLREEVPGFRAGAFALAGDGRTALAEDAGDGNLYLVTLRGIGIVTRRLSRDVVRKIKRDGATLDLRLADFSFPKARIAFAEEGLAQDWEARFTRLVA